MIRVLLTFLLLAGILPAEDQVKPAIKRINENELQIGKIHLNQKTKEISFGAGVNMSQGLLEYAVVLTKGKVHESLFLTDVSPLNLNIALKLLRFGESPELFEIIDKDFNPTGKYPEVSPETKKAARLDILVRWKDGETEKTEPLNNLILHSITGKPMLPGPWLNTGSYMHEGKFKAEVAGDVIAIFTSQPAMVNYPGKDRKNDDVWIPNTKRLPEVGSVVTIILKPYQS